VTNKSNPVANLTSAEVTSIFTGKVRSWSQVPGATSTGPIDLISRTLGSGALSSFQTVLLGGKSVSSIAAQEPSDGLEYQQVQNDPNGITFVTNYRSDKGQANVVALNGVACNLANAISGQYGGVSRFYEVTKGKATGAASAFIGWIEKSAAARKIVSTQWIPISH
jgi:phosphate transport system substrate-binding protein